MNELRKILDRINDIWEKHDNINNWIGVVWLIKKQIEEIEKSQYLGHVVLNEFADILIMINRYLDKIHIDPEKLMLYRLETRHKGKTAQIVQKYNKIFAEEQECNPRLCPFCVDYDTCLLREKHERKS